MERLKVTYEVGWEKRRRLLRQFRPVYTPYIKRVEIEEKLVGYGGRIGSRQRSFERHHPQPQPAIGVIPGAIQFCPEAYQLSEY